MENLSNTHPALLNGNYYPYAVALKGGDKLLVGGIELLYQTGMLLSEMRSFLYKNFFDEGSKELSTE